MGCSMGYSMGGASNVTTLGVGTGGGTWRGADPHVEDVGRKDGAGAGLGAEVRGTQRGS